MAELNCLITLEVKKLCRDILKERFAVEFADDNYRLAFMAMMKKVNAGEAGVSEMIVEELLVAWDDFVTDLNNGYEMSLYEFQYDLDSLRGPIDLLYSNVELDEIEEHKKLKSVIKIIDDKFKQLTVEIIDLPNRNAWWEWRILLKANSDYFDSLGIDLTRYKIIRT